MSKKAVWQLKVGAVCAGMCVSSCEGCKSMPRGRGCGAVGAIRPRHRGGINAYPPTKREPAEMNISVRVCVCVCVCVCVRE